MATNSSGITVSIQAKVEGWQSELKRIQAEAEKINLGTSLGKDLTRYLSTLEKQINSMGKNLTQNFTSDASIDRFGNRVEDIEERFQHIGQILSGIQLGDLNVEYVSAQLQPLIDQVNQLQAQLNNELDAAWGDKIAGEATKVQKAFARIGQSEENIKTLTVEGTRSALQEIVTSAIKQVDEATKKMDELQDKINKYKTTKQEWESSTFGQTTNIDSYVASIVSKDPTSYGFTPAINEEALDKIKKQIHDSVNEIKISQSKKDEIEKALNDLVPTNSVETIRKRIGTIKQLLDGISGRDAFHLDAASLDNYLNSIFNKVDPSIIDENLNRIKERFIADGISEEDLNKFWGSFSESIKNQDFDKAINVVSTNLSQLYEEYKSITDKIRDAQKEFANAQSEQFRAAWTRSFGEDGLKELDALIAKYTEASETAKQLNKAQKELDQKTGDLVQQPSNTGKNVINESTQRYKELTSEIQAYKAELADVQAKEQLIGKIQGVAQRWFSIYAAVRLVENAIKSVISTVTELDNTITEIAIVTDMGQEELWKQMPQYTALAQQYAASISGVYQVSQLYYQQGLDTVEVMELTEQTLKMARISGLDYAQATDYMTNAIRSFKMEMSDAQSIVDVYSAIAAASATDTTELASAMSKTASSAQAVGSSFEDTTAMMAVMIEATRESAENIGSAMKSIISRYGEMTSDPSKLVDSEGEVMSLNRVDTALQTVGITIHDTEGKFRSFSDVIVELAEKWDTIDTNTQRYIATTMAGNRQQSRFLALVSSGDRLNELMTIADESEDASQLQYLKTLDSITAKTQQLQTSLQTLYTNTGVENWYKSLLDTANNVLATFNKMPKVFNLPIAAIANFGIQFYNIASVVTTVVAMIKNDLVTQAQQVQGLITEKTREASEEQIEITRSKVQAQEQIEQEGAERRANIAAGNTTAGTTKTIFGKEVNSQTYSKLSLAARAAGTALSFVAAGMNEATTTARVTKGALEGVSGALSAFGYWISGNPFMAIVSGVMAAVNMIDTIIETTEERAERLSKAAEEANNKRIQSSANYKDLKSELDQIKELEKTYNDSAEAKAEYYEHTNAIAEQYPMLVAAYDSEGNAIINLQKAYEELNRVRGEAKEDTLDSIVKSYEKAENAEHQAALNRENAQLQKRGEVWGAHYTTESYADKEQNRFSISDVKAPSDIQSWVNEYTGMSLPDIATKMLETFGDTLSPSLSALLDELKNYNFDSIEELFSSDEIKAGLSTSISAVSDDSIRESLQWVYDQISNNILEIGGIAEVGKAQAATAAKEAVKRQGIAYMTQQKFAEVTLEADFNGGVPVDYIKNFNAVGSVVNGFIEETFDKAVEDIKEGEVAPSYSEWIKSNEANKYYDDVLKEIQAFWSQLSSEQQTSLNQLITQRGSMSVDKFKEKLLKYTGITDGETGWYKELLDYYTEAFDVEKLHASLEKRKESNANVEALDNVLAQYDDVILKATFGPDELIKVLNTYDAITSRINNKAISITQGAEIFDQYLKAFEGQDDEVQNVLSEVDLFSFTSIMDAVHSLSDATKFDQTAVNPAINALRELSHLIPLNINTEAETLVAKVTEGLSDMESSIKHITKGMDYKTMTEEVQKLGLKTGDFQLKAGKYTPNDYAEVVNKMITDYNNQFTDLITETKQRHERALKSNNFADALDALGITEEQFKKEQDNYSEYVQESGETAKGFIEWYFDSQIQTITDTSGQVKAYLTDVFAREALEGGQLETFASLAFGEEGKELYDANKNIILAAIGAGDISTLPQELQSYLKQYQSLIVSTFSSVQSSIFDSLIAAVGQTGTQKITVTDANRSNLLELLKRHSNWFVNPTQYLNENGEATLDGVSEVELAAEQLAQDVQTFQTELAKTMLSSADYIKKLSQYHTNKYSNSTLASFKKVAGNDTFSFDDIATFLDATTEGGIQGKDIYTLIANAGLTIDSAGNILVDKLDTWLNLVTDAANTIITDSNTSQEEKNAARALLRKTRQLEAAKYDKAFIDIFNNYNQVSIDQLQALADALKLDYLQLEAYFISNGDGTYSIDTTKIQQLLALAQGKVSKAAAESLNKSITTIADDYFKNIQTAANYTTQGASSLADMEAFRQSYANTVGKELSADAFSYDSVSKSFVLGNSYMQEYINAQKEKLKQMKYSEEFINQYIKDQTDNAIRESIALDGFLNAQTSKQRNDEASKLIKQINSLSNYRDIAMFASNITDTIEITKEEYDLAILRVLESGSQNAVNLLKKIKPNASPEELEAVYNSQINKLNDAMNQVGDLVVGQFVGTEGKLYEILARVGAVDENGVVQTGFDMVAIYAAIYDEMTNTAGATTAGLNDAYAKLLTASDQQNIDIVDALQNTSGMTYEALGKMLANYGKSLTEFMANASKNGIKKTGFGKIKITDWNTFAQSVWGDNLSQIENTPEYINAFKEYSNGLKQAIVDGIKQIEVAKAGDILDLTEIDTLVQNTLAHRYDDFITNNIKNLGNRVEVGPEIMNEAFSGIDWFEPFVKGEYATLFGRTLTGANIKGLGKNIGISIAQIDEAGNAINNIEEYINDLVDQALELGQVIDIDTIRELDQKNKNLILDIRAYSESLTDDQIWDSQDQITQAGHYAEELPKIIAGYYQDLLSLGAVYEEGILKLGEDADTLGIYNVFENLLETIQSASKEDYSDQINQIKDSINSLINGYVDSISNGIKGTLNNQQAEQLKQTASHWGLRNYVDYEQTADGLQLTTDSALTLYGALSLTNKALSQKLLPDIMNMSKSYGSLRGVMEAYSRATKYSTKADRENAIAKFDGADATYEFAYALEKVALRDIYNHMLDDPETYNVFGKHPMSGNWQSTKNLYDSSWQAAQYIKQAGKGSMKMEEFWDMMSVLGDSKSSETRQWALNMLQNATDYLDFDRSGNPIINTQKLLKGQMNKLKDYLKTEFDTLQQLGAERQQLYVDLFYGSESLQNLDSIWEKNDKGKKTGNLVGNVEEKLREAIDKGDQQGKNIETLLSKFIDNTKNSNESLADKIKAGKELSKEEKNLIKGLAEIDWETADIEEQVKQLSKYGVGGKIKIDEEGNVSFEIDYGNSKEWEYEFTVDGQTINGKEAFAEKALIESQKNVADWEGQDDGSITTTFTLGGNDITVKIDANGKVEYSCSIKDGPTITADSMEGLKIALMSVVEGYSGEDSTTTTNGGKTHNITIGGQSYQITMNGSVSEVKLVDENGNEITDKAGEYLDKLSKGAQKYTEQQQKALDLGNISDATVTVGKLTVKIDPKTETTIAPENGENKEINLKNPIGEVIAEVAKFVGKLVEGAERLLSEDSYEGDGVPLDDIDKATAEVKSLELSMQGEERPYLLEALEGPVALQDIDRAEAKVKQLEIAAKAIKLADDGDIQGLESLVTALQAIANNEEIELNVKTNSDIGNTFNILDEIDNRLKGIVISKEALAEAISIMISVSGADAAWDAANALNSIPGSFSREYKITTTYVTHGTPPSSGTPNITKPGKTNSSQQKGPVKQLPKATGNFGFAKAKGTSTLMGELGPELVVSNGRYFVAGQNGAEMVDLTDDAIVFNHLQTEQLLKKGMSSGRGKAVTNEKKAVAYAHGNINGGPAMALALHAEGGGGGHGRKTSNSTPNKNGAQFTNTLDRSGKRVTTTIRRISNNIQDASDSSQRASQAQIEAAEEQRRAAEEAARAAEEAAKAAEEQARLQKEAAKAQREANRNAGYHSETSSKGLLHPSMANDEWIHFEPIDYGEIVEESSGGSSGGNSSGGSSSGGGSSRGPSGSSGGSSGGNGLASGSSIDKAMRASGGGGSSGGGAKKADRSGGDDGDDGITESEAKSEISSLLNDLLGKGIEYVREIGIDAYENLTPTLKANLGAMIDSGESYRAFIKKYAGALNASMKEINEKYFEAWQKDLEAGGLSEEIMDAAEGLSFYANGKIGGSASDWTTIFGNYADVAKAAEAGVIEWNAELRQYIVKDEQALLEYFGTNAAAIHNWETVKLDNAQQIWDEINDTLKDAMSSEGITNKEANKLIAQLRQQGIFVKKSEIFTRNANGKLVLLSDAYAKIAGQVEESAKRLEEAAEASEAEESATESAESIANSAKRLKAVKNGEKYKITNLSDIQSDESIEKLTLNEINDYIEDIYKLAQILDEDSLKELEVINQKLAARKTLLEQYAAAAIAANAKKLIANKGEDGRYTIGNLGDIEAKFASGDFTVDEINAYMADLELLYQLLTDEQQKVVDVVYQQLQARKNELMQSSSNVTGNGRRAYDAAAKVNDQIKEMLSSMTNTVIQAFGPDNFINESDFQTLLNNLRSTGKSAAIAYAAELEKTAIKTEKGIQFTWEQIMEYTRVMADNPAQILEVLNNLDTTNLNNDQLAYIEQSKKALNNKGAAETADKIIERYSSMVNTVINALGDDNFISNADFQQLLDDLMATNTDASIAYAKKLKEEVEKNGQQTEKGVQLTWEQVMEFVQTLSDKPLQALDVLNKIDTSQLNDAQLEALKQAYKYYNDQKGMAKATDLQIERAKTIGELLNSGFGYGKVLTNEQVQQLKTNLTADGYKLSEEQIKQLDEQRQVNFDLIYDYISKQARDNPEVAREFLSNLDSSAYSIEELQKLYDVAVISGLETEAAAIKDKITEIINNISEASKNGISSQMSFAEFDELKTRLAQAGFQGLTEADYKTVYNGVELTWSGVQKIMGELIAKGATEEAQALLEAYNDRISEKIGKETKTTSGALKTAVEGLTFIDSETVAGTIDQLKELANIANMPLDELLKLAEWDEKLQKYVIKDKSKIKNVKWDEIEQIQDTIVDGINEFISTLTDTIKNGIAGTLKSADITNIKGMLAQYVSKDVNLDLDFTKTAEGLKLTEESAIKLYTILKQVDDVHARLVFTELNESLKKSNDHYETIHTTMARIVELKEKIASAEARRDNTKVKQYQEELALAKEILAVRATQEDESMNFMDQDIPGALKNPFNYAQSITKAMQALREAFNPTDENTKPGFLGYQDFYNIGKWINEQAGVLGKEIEWAGVKLNGSWETFGRLLEKGSQALTATESGEIKVSLEKLGIGLKSGFDTAAGLTTEGMQVFAKSQIEVIDGLINFLETIVAMKDLENLDESGDGIINLPEIFSDTEMSKYTEKYQAFGKQMLELAQEGTPLRKAIEEVKINGISVEKILEDAVSGQKNINLSAEELQQALQALYELAKSNDWDLNSIGESLGKILAGLNKDKIAITYGDQTIRVISGKVVIEAEKDGKTVYEYNGKEYTDMKQIYLEINKKKIEEIQAANYQGASSEEGSNIINITFHDLITTTLELDSTTGQLIDTQTKKPYATFDEFIEEQRLKYNSQHEGAELSDIEFRAEFRLLPTITDASNLTEEQIKVLKDAGINSSKALEKAWGESEEDHMKFAIKYGFFLQEDSEGLNEDFKAKLNEVLADETKTVYVTATYSSESNPTVAKLLNGEETTATVSVNADVSPANTTLDDFKKNKLDQLKANVVIEAQNLAGNVINNLEQQLDRLVGKTIKVEVVNTVSTTSTDGSSSAKGTFGGVALAGGSKQTLMGELGPELYVSNGRYHVVGRNGAEFVSLPNDAIVFNHLQTEKLLDNGKSGRGTPITNEVNAVSMARGNVGPAKASADAALAMLKSLRAAWESLAGMTTAQLAGKASQNAGGEDAKNWIATVERWYDYLQKIARLEKEINKEEALRNTLMSEQVAHGDLYYKSQLATLNEYKEQAKTYQALAQEQEAFFEKRRAELNAARSPFSEFYSYDEYGQIKYNEGGLEFLSSLMNTNEQGKPDLSIYQKYRKFYDYKDANGNYSLREYMKYDSSGNKIGSNDYEAAVQAIWERMEAEQQEMQSLYDSKEDAKAKTLEGITSANKILEEIRKNQIDLENKVLEAIEAREQALIDKLSEEREQLQDASSKYVKGLQDALSKEREMYQQNNEDRELVQLQRRLAILQRSGGSQSDILNLQKQVQDKNREAYFDAQEAQIKVFEEASNEQLERMETQINIMTETLAFQKEHGLLQAEMNQILQGTSEAITAFITGNTKDWQAKTALSQEEESRQILFMAQQYETMIGNNPSTVTAEDYYSVFKPHEAYQHGSSPDIAWDYSNPDAAQTTLTQEQIAKMREELISTYSKDNSLVASIYSKLLKGIDSWNRTVAYSPDKGNRIATTNLNQNVQIVIEKLADGYDTNRAVNDVLAALQEQASKNGANTTIRR